MPAWITGLIGNWRIAAISAALAFAIGFGGGYKLKSLFVDSAEATRLEAQAKADKDARAAADKASADWQAKLDAMRAANKQLTGRLYAETRKAIYSTCVVPDDGVQIYNNALTGSDAP